MNSNNIVINWHITQRCNFACKHCFVAKHKKCDSAVIANSLPQSKKLLQRIYRAFSQRYSSIRLNLAGGEPLLVSNLDILIKEAKSIGFDISIISNASLLAGLDDSIAFDYQRWIEQNAGYLSWFGMSIDSLNEATNIKIGRCLRTQNVLKESDIFKITHLLREQNKKLKLKINTVVTAHNYDEYLGDFIRFVQPNKWKILQALSIDTPKVFCDDKQFKVFLDRHKGFKNVVVESKNQMINSYIMIDSFGRFYQNANLCYSYSPCVLEMSSDKILDYACFDENKFQSRYKIDA